MTVYIKNLFHTKAPPKIKGNQDWYYRIDENSLQEFITLDKMLDEVQASEKELKAYLCGLDAIEINGFFY